MAVLPLLVYIALVPLALLALTGWLSNAQIWIILLLIVMSIMLLLILGLRAIFEYVNESERAMVVAVELDDALGDRRSSDVGWEQEVEIVVGQGEIGSLQSLIHQMEVRHELLREWLAYREETESMGVSDTIDGAFTTDAFSDLLRPGLEQGLREAEVEFIMMSAVTEFATYERFRTSHPRLPAICVAEIMMDETERQLSLEDLVSLTEWSHTLALMTVLSDDYDLARYSEITGDFIKGHMPRTELDRLQRHVHRAINLLHEADQILSSTPNIARDRVKPTSNLERIDIASFESSLSDLRKRADEIWGSSDLDEIATEAFEDLLRTQGDRLLEFDHRNRWYRLNNQDGFWRLEKVDGHFSLFDRVNVRYISSAELSETSLGPERRDGVISADELARQLTTLGISRSEFGVGVPPFTPPTARQLYRDELGGT
jgi:hypothetical protein